MMVSGIKSEYMKSSEDFLFFFGIETDGFRDGKIPGALGTFCVISGLSPSNFYRIYISDPAISFILIADFVGQAV